MRIRQLREEDAPLMLEWMKDDSVVHDLAADFSGKTIKDCESFIDNAIEQYKTMNTCRDLHMAIADDADEYMGTVSLKNIDRDLRRAEFAITIRKAAMGHGYAIFGMEEIIRKGFNDPDLNLKSIYWCVNKKNLRARKFYDKNKFMITEPSEDMLIAYEEIFRHTELIWYLVRK